MSAVESVNVSSMDVPSLREGMNYDWFALTRAYLQEPEPREAGWPANRRDYLAYTAESLDDLPRDGAAHVRSYL